MITKSLVVEPFAENAWILGCREGGVGVAVDPGGRVPELIALAEREAVPIREIWLTHAHLDHVTGVAELAEATGAPVRLHPADRELYDQVDRQAMMFGLTASPPPAPDHDLEEGERLELGRLRAEVLFVPGHSPGHVAFWFAEQELVVSGDCLFAGSIGRTDLPGGSHAVLMSSIRGRLLPLGDDVRVLPGHGPETTIGRERASNPFLLGAGSGLA